MMFLQFIVAMSALAVVRSERTVPTPTVVSEPVPAAAEDVPTPVTAEFSVPTQALLWSEPVPAVAEDQPTPAAASLQSSAGEFSVPTQLLDEATGSADEPVAASLQSSAGEFSVPTHLLDEDDYSYSYSFPYSPVNKCLDPYSTDYRCSVDGDGQMYLNDCGITDEDVEAEYLTACFDAAGSRNILRLFLDYNQLTTVTEGVFDSLTELEYLNVANNGLTSLSPGIFDSLTALTFLTIGWNDLTSLPSGIFDSLTELETLYISQNSLETLPSGVFDSLTKLTGLVMDHNRLTTLPSGVFDSLTQLYSLNLGYNDLGSLPPALFASNTELFRLSLQDLGLTTLPLGIFDSLTNLFSLGLSFNSLSTLPAGIFDSLTELSALYAIANPDLECVPTLPSSETGVDVDASVGTECGCELPDGTSPCGEDETCTSGAAGYTCGLTTGGTCSNGIEGIDNNGAVCCPLSCGSCGGRGCGSRPGGSSECCRGRIEASGVYCDDSGAAPCIIGSDPGQTCSNGIEGIDANGVVCCPLSCGACAGPGCADLPGGASECCGGTIKAFGIMCSESGTAPCVI